MSLRRALVWAGALTLGAVLVGGLVSWHLGGGRWVHVESASMGTQAPVGSLLWVEPVSYADLRPGDFITFREPGRPDSVFSHRIAAITADGGLRTKGLLPAEDPWTLGPADVIGQVTLTWHGAGWVVVLAPVLAVGSALVGLVRVLVRGAARTSLELLVGAATLAVAVVVYHPLVGAQQLAFAPTDQQGTSARATYISTGLLPVRISAYRGETLDLHPGETGTVEVRRTDPAGRWRVDLRPLVPSWLWAGLIGVCFLPALREGWRSHRRRRVPRLRPCHARSSGFWPSKEMSVSTSRH